MARVFARSGLSCVEGCSRLVRSSASPSAQCWWGPIWRPIFRSCSTGRSCAVGSSPPGAEFIYHIGRSGFWFGMMPVLTGEPMHLAITAHTNVVAMVIGAFDVVRIAAERPEHYARFAGLPFLRLRRALEIIDHSEISRSARADRGAALPHAPA